MRAYYTYTYESDDGTFLHMFLLEGDGYLAHRTETKVNYSRDIRYNVVIVPERVMNRRIVKENTE